MSHIGYLKHHARLAEARRAQEGETEMFTAPSAPSGGIKWEDHKNALLLIEPTSFEPQVQTSYGPADAVKATVHVLEGTGAGESYTDTLIFPKLLVSQTKSAMGEKVLGRLGQGQGKPGQSPPWILSEATAEDITKAEAWVKEHEKPAVTSAAAPF